ncbi:MAG: hypothetical protein RBR40_08255 [Tenuifilaceae bacterium]|jgi:hypothetical protein|nr:hypothetical protein [Tenuifilaceae bacterium]
MKNIVVLIVLMGIVSSCSRHTAPVVEVPVKTVEITRERLVTWVVPADSSYLSLLLECDSLNNVIVKELSEQKGKNTSTDFSISNNKVVYKTIYKRDTIYVPVTDTIIIKDRPIKIEIPVEVNRLTWWQQTLVWAGGVLLFLVLIIVLRFLIKIKSGI